MLLRDWVLNVAYALLTFLVNLRNSWLRLAHSLSETCQSYIESYPRLSSIFRSGTSTGRRRGSAPRHPTVLGAVLVLPHKGDQDDQALCRLLTWARHRGFRQVLIYDPRGEVQQRRRKLEDAVRWADPSGRISVWNGWTPPPEWDLLNSDRANNKAGIDSATAAVPAAMGVALLSADDAEGPLAAASISNISSVTREVNREGSEGGVTALQAALAAPAEVKARIVGASGPLAAEEPDLVLVFGGTMTLAGFPSWAVRTSELFDVGRLGELTGSKLDAVMRRFLGTRQRFGREATPQLPEDHNRLRRRRDAGPHTPEQVHIAFAGPGALTLSWVTWPQDDPEYEAILAVSSDAAAYEELDLQVTSALSASRKLQMDLGRHHHHHHKHHGDDDTDPSQSRHCRALRKLDLRSAVQWGTSPGDYSHTVFGSLFECYSTTAFDSGALHHVVIGEEEGPIPPNTTLFYRVGDPGRDSWSPEAAVRSPPAVGPASLPYRLGLVGDLGQTEHSLTTLVHAEALSPDSYMFVGDLSYADGYQPRWDTWGRMMSPHTEGAVWMFTEGNHEIEPTNGAPDFLAYTKRFRHPLGHADSPSPLFFSYEVAGVHVIMLGSYAEFDSRSEQYTWLERDLARVDRTRTPWVVVGMHAPWYNSNYNHYEEGEGMRLSMESLLYQHGVDAVISGHVHAYERSFPTYDGRRDDCGPIHINVGDGGNREGLDFEYYPQPEWSAFREPSYGAGALDFINSTHASFTWYRNQDGEGTVADDAQLVRDPECRTNGKERLAALLAGRRK